MYRALSLFSGCGGFCEGMRLAGFEVVGAVEHDRFAAETYRHNFPEVPLFEGDVAHFLNDAAAPWKTEVQRFPGVRPEAVDLLFGGPPCQGYSQIGPRELTDPRNQLYGQYLRIARHLMPKVLVMENVPNMLLLAKGRFKREVLAAFEMSGYSNADVRVLSANDFGVPQTRDRAIFIGVRDDLDFAEDIGPWMERAVLGQHRPTATVSQAIGDLPAEPAPDYRTLQYPGAPKVMSPIAREMRLDVSGAFYPTRYKKKTAGGLLLHNHHTKEIQERRRKLIPLLAPGKKADSLPIEVWNGSRPEKWRRFHPDWPAHTLLAQMHRDLSEWIHPTEHRWITVREAARLQSFHDGFVFKSSEWQMLKQIGNAVPPLLARAIGAVALSLLDQAGRTAHSRVGSQVASGS